ncbi:MAG: VPLPA-CTERM-specific exosortase XrtD [Gammaproteobacteria bacterium]|nr:VPLPA-CTERM-specific exosortase XrtD [Gammaproteobacteria bacterium]
MSDRVIFKMPAIIWAMIFVLLSLSWFLFEQGILEMIKSWEREEYSHGYLIPMISIFLVWQKKDVLEKIPFTGSWYGVMIVLLGVVLYGIGTLSAVIDIVAYGFVVTVMGVCLAFMGYSAFKIIFMPLAILLFMVPLPGFLYQTLSNELQLISSMIGVWFIRLFDISVFLEGNIIDLGVYKLQVVEACSGLRYLFPFMTLGFIAAYFFKVDLWKRILIFFSTIPITILMNSLRIGIIGVTVEYWGVKMAEGILHDFEGWFMFMVCMAVLILEVSILTKIGKDSRPLVQVFGLELPDSSPADNFRTERLVPNQFIIIFMIIVTVSVSMYMLPERVDLIPDRKNFYSFPKKFDHWIGNNTKMDQKVLDSLNLDDYIMSDYLGNKRQDLVNLYIGYYATQRADKVPHSPKACIPGGGWLITNASEILLNGLHVGDTPLSVNRMVIEKSGSKKLVYYWLQQRGRVVTNQWAVKLYLLLDSIYKSRTDGALVRFITPIHPGEDLTDGDKRLTLFASELVGILPEYVPE